MPISPSALLGKIFRCYYSNGNDVEDLSRMELQKVVDSQDKLPSEAPIRVHTLPPPPNFPKKTTRSTFPP